LNALQVVQHAGQQTRKSPFEFIKQQEIEQGGAVSSATDDASFAQHAEVVR
jgi:hypothetical protein